MAIIYKNGIAYGNQRVLDATLTQQGEDADAKAVGDALALKAGTGVIADDFSTSQSYAIGDYTYYNGSLYRFTAAHSAGAWVGTDAQAVQLAEDVVDLKNTLNHMENGVNENMTAGNAMQLDSSVYAEDQVPYLFRQTGGGVNAGTREIDTIVGGTVVWNQLVKNGDFHFGVNLWGATNASYSASNNILSFTANAQYGNVSPSNDETVQINGHKYIGAAKIKLTTATNQVTLALNRGNKLIYSNSTTEWQTLCGIVQATSDSGNFIVGVADRRASGWDAVQVTDVILTDLTAMFGTVIADRAYALEQATAGSGIAWLKSMGFFTQDYYPSDTGTLKSVEGLQSHDMRDANDTLIASYPLDSGLMLRGIPKLDANNKLYYDGDTYESDGTVTRRYGSINLGDQTWTAQTLSGNRTAFSCLYTSWESAPKTDYNSAPNAVCGFASPTYQGASAWGKDTFLFVSQASSVMMNSLTFIFDDTKYADATAFKSAMSGKLFVYELATPTTETADPFQTPQICDKSGTEEYVTTGIVPVGHLTKYPEDLRAKIEGLPWNLSMIAPIENGATASQAYTTGQYFLHNDLFCKALTSIASGATFTLNTNYAVTTVAAELYAAINS